MTEDAAGCIVQERFRGRCRTMRPAASSSASCVNVASMQFSSTFPSAIPLFDHTDSFNCCVSLPWRQILPTVASRRECFAPTFLEARDGRAGMMRPRQRGRDNGAGATGTGQGGWDKKARTVRPGRKGKHDKASTTRPGRQGIGRQGPGRQGPGRRRQDGDAKTAMPKRQGWVDKARLMRRGQ